MQQATLSYRYAVMQWREGTVQRIGVVLANNFSHASKKAQQLFNRHVFVERL